MMPTQMQGIIQNNIFSNYANQYSKVIFYSQFEWLYPFGFIGYLIVMMICFLISIEVENYCFDY
jgi:hypothetical protein